MTLAENEERDDASPFWTAQLYKRIMAAEKLSPEQLPDYLKKDRSTVYRVLSIAGLPTEVESMSQRCDIGFSHLIELVKLPKPEQQVQLAQECAEKDYSVRELQARVKRLLDPGTHQGPGKAAAAVQPLKLSWITSTSNSSRCTHSPRG